MEGLVYCESWYIPLLIVIARVFWSTSQTSYSRPSIPITTSRPLLLYPNDQHPIFTNKRMTDPPRRKALSCSFAKSIWIPLRTASRTKPPRLIKVSTVGSQAPSSCILPDRLLRGLVLFCGCIVAMVVLTGSAMAGMMKAKVITAVSLM